MEPLDPQSSPSQPPAPTLPPTAHPATAPRFSLPPAWRWLLLISIFSLSSLLAWRFWSPPPPAVSQPPGASPAGSSQRRSPLPRPVEVIALQPGQGIRSIQLLGQAEASAQATLRAQTSGILREILVQPGDRVTPGTTIALLEDSDQRLALAEAQAQLAQAQSNLARLTAGTRREILAQRQANLRSATARERAATDNLNRIQSLVQEGAFSQRALVEAKAAVDGAHSDRLVAEATLAEAQAGPIPAEIAAQQAQVAAAQANLNQAQLALDRTQIRATAAGIVQTRQVSPGDYIQTSGELITLIASDRLDIFLELPEELSGKVSPGMAIQLTARALPQWRATATITGVVPATDPTSRRQQIRVRLDHPPATLLPGMAITGTLTQPSNQPSFRISRDALTQRQDQWYVFRITDTSAQQIPVNLVADMGETVAIYSDRLQIGDSIVIRGGDGLRDEMRVKIVGQ